MFRKLLYFFILSCTIFSLQASSLDECRQDISFTTSLEHDISKQGKIIFVTGSCSSGKSSMARVIAQKMDAKFLNFDEYVMPMVLKKFVTKHYGKFLAFFIGGMVMRNFFKFVNFLSDKKKYAFQIKFYNDLRQGLADEPTTKMFREVKKIAENGQNVVVESPIYLWEGVDFLKNLNEFKGTNITYVSAYCPWNNLVDRLIQRNSTSNKKIRRELDWVVINYMYCFDVSSDLHGENFVECLNGENVRKIITEYSQPQYKKRRLCLLPETQHIALQKFPEAVNYYIYPRFKYDVTVNTKTNTPEQGAQVVLDYVQQKCS